MHYVATAIMMLAIGCGSSPVMNGDDTGAPDAAGTQPDSATLGDGDGGVSYGHLCNAEPPPGARMPPPPPSYSGGTCPTLVAGRNTIRSSGTDREFILVMPEEIQPGETLPLGFLWHPLGSDASVFLKRGELPEAIESERFMAMLPEAKGDLQLQWPWTGIDSEARVEEELRFFDDMFACVTEQFAINMSCVSNGGVSSGGLWASQVGWRRGEHFSALLSISGGSGDGSVVKEWGGSPHKMPVLVLWGGPTDSCIVFNFTDTSKQLEQQLVADGHFVLECVHNCGHALPPFEPPPGQSDFAPIWDFVLNHPYWLEDGQSPYQNHIPESMPTWCAVGAGNAVPRTGECLEPSQC